MRSLGTLGLGLLVGAACNDASAPRTPTTDVTPPPIFKCAGSPTVSPGAATLSPGDSVRAFALPGCSAIPVTTRWESSDTSVAIVVSRGSEGLAAVGMIAALRAGQAAVTARSVADPTISSTMAVVVR